MSKDFKPIPSENIEATYKDLEKLEQKAIQDLVINPDMEQNFNNVSKIYDWVKEYNIWTKRHRSLDSEYKRIRSIRYFIHRESNIYNMTEKEINTKLDTDEILISYKTILEAIELIIEFIKKIQSLLDNQRYDIKEKFAYLRWINGEDF